MRSDIGTWRAIRRQVARTRRGVVARLGRDGTWRGPTRETARRIRQRIDPRSLTRMASGDRAIGRADRGFLHELEDSLDRRSPERVALLLDGRTAGLAGRVAARWPSVTVLCLVTDPGVAAELRAQQSGSAAVEAAPNASVEHALLTAHGPFDVIVDWAARPAGESSNSLADTLHHLRRGGSYITAAVTADLDATPGARRSRHCVLIDSPPPALPKMRYHEMDRVLTIRRTLGRVVLTLPAETVSTRATVTMNRPNPGAAFAQRFSVPAVGIRVYSNVTCAPHQVLTAENILLPDSYRHYLNGILKNAYVDEVSPRFARHRDRPATGDRLVGTYFYLGSEYPQHFGHVMTEQLSRLWGWPEVKRRYPDAKALVELDRRHRQLPVWETEIYGAAGIDQADLVVTDRPVQVEELVAATPMLVNTQYVHPGITAIWSRAADALAESAPRGDHPDRLFISRKSSHTKRQCTNTDEVETLFRGLGFTVVYPEDRGLAEQVALFRQASVVAGFAGSGLFTLLFCSEPKTVIVLWPETYTSRNEYLICSALGHRLHVFWCAPDRRHPVGGWTKKAYQSSYTFDVAADGARLRALLDRS